MGTHPCSRPPRSLVFLPFRSAAESVGGPANGIDGLPETLFMLPPPNEIERRILDYIESYLRRHTYQPSVREIGARFGIKSTKTVSEHLKALTAKGFLERDPSRSRGARIVGLDLNAEARSVPCHTRIPRQRDDFREEESVPSYAIDRRLAGGAGSFFVRVSADEAGALGYEDGDLLLVQPLLAHEIRHGDVLAVHRADGAGFYRYDGSADVLRPGSADAPAIPVVRLEDLAVAGRVSAFLRRVGADPGADTLGDASPSRRWRRSSRRVADAREGRGRRGRRHR